MITLKVHWAHIDETGRVVSWGTAMNSDVFLQPLESGLTCLARPEEVNGFENVDGTVWAYQDEEWKKILLA